MNKLFLSSFIVLSFIAYGLFNHFSSPASSPTTAATGTPQVAGVTVARASAYKDGTYTGKVADAFYGNVQVQTTISGGKITDVRFLDYPQDKRTSQEINNQAMPVLKSEAIAVQSAQVDLVSGATQTSRAFIESLSNALTQAG